MTTTSAREDRLTDPGSPAAPPATAFTPPPKLRRRPSLIAAGVVAVCLGALLAAWVWSATTDTREVLAARDTIHRGEVITAADLERVRINADPGLKPVPASAYEEVVGQRAALDIAAGGLLTTESATSGALPPEGQSIVGIALTQAQVPALRLRGGDQVRIIVTPGDNGDAPTGSPPFTTAEVVDTRLDEATGNTIVDVVVPHADAGVLAARAATGNVALVLDSGEQ